MWFKKWNRLPSGGVVKPPPNPPLTINFRVEGAAAYEESLSRILRTLYFTGGDTKLECDTLNSPPKSREGFNMAKADNISVAVETAVHNAAREMAQTVWDKYKIKIMDVDIKWRDVSTTSAAGFVVDIMSIQTETKT